MREEKAVVLGNCLPTSTTFATAWTGIFLPRPLRLFLPVRRVVHLARFAQGVVGVAVGVFEQLHAGAKVVPQEVIEGAEGGCGIGPVILSPVDGQLRDDEQGI